MSASTFDQLSCIDLAMAAAMLSRLVAVAVLVAALMCAVAVQAQVPAAGGAPVCEIVDQNVVNACFKTLGEGMNMAKPRPTGFFQRVM